MDSNAAHIVAELARLTGGDDLPGSTGVGVDPAFLRFVLHIARNTKRIFELPVLDAPGLKFVGAEFDPATFGLPTIGTGAVSAAGTGATSLRATISCVCEAAEYLSQVAGPEQRFSQGHLDPRETGLEPSALTHLLSMAGIDPTSTAPDISWASATGLVNGASVLVPASLCFRNVQGPAPGKPPGKLSAGCGAGPTREAALLHGLLELVERDAIALWWLGGRRGCELATKHAGAATAYVEHLRQGADNRPSWLIDLTNDIEIPCVAAVSVDANGRGLACGFAARLTYEEAAKAAIRELCQMELGLHLIALKRRQRGDAALNPADHIYLRRAYGIDVPSCALLHPLARSTPTIALPTSEVASPLAQVTTRFAARNMEAFWVDLTKPDLGIPTVRCLSADLAPYPSQIISKRLKRQIQQTGGGFDLKDRVELM